MSLSLFTQLRAATTDDARLSLRNQLVELHSPLVGKIARRLCESWRLPNADDLGDMTSEGYLGLIDAVERFDPAHASGAEFTTFADRVISRKMASWVRSKRSLTSAHVAASGLTVWCESDLNDELFPSFDTFDTRAGKAFGEFELRDALANAFRAVDEEVDAQAKAIQTSWARAKQVIKLRLVDGLGPNEIAEEIGTTPSNVCNIITRGVSRLKPHLGDLYPDA